MASKNGYLTLVQRLLDSQADANQAGAVLPAVPCYLPNLNSHLLPNR
jgi:hypothetical protein